MTKPVVLAKADKELAQRALTDRRLAFTTFPELFDPILLPPRTLNILIVTDSRGSFGPADWGLKTLVDTLTISSGPWVGIAVTTAHRTTAEGAAMPDFRFDQVPLDDYDEIWLFGVDVGAVPSLSEAELAHLSRFMDGGGGVFATGDHEALGVTLCGRVPRVRSMRKWYFPDPGPNREPVAPQSAGVTQNTTLHAGHDGSFEDNDQSDDIPQTILPRMYRAPSASSHFFVESEVPHPLLCGPQGPIRILPDHVHEGECYVPDDLGMSFTFDGTTIEEYPPLPSGERLAPEIVAWSTVATGGSSRTFGAISAYDGHRVNVGRVVCDATWHHFFNLNLVGDPTASDPEKHKGFEASAQGKAHLETIKAYFRNIAVWLARKESLVEMLLRVLWMLRWDHEVVITFRPTVLQAGLENIDLEEFLRVGAYARNALRRMSSPCQAHGWMLELVATASPGLFQEIAPHLDPYSPRRASPELTLSPLLRLHGLLLLESVLGAALYQLAEQFPERTREAHDSAPEISLTSLARRSLQLAFPRVEARTGRIQESLAGWVGRMREAL